MSIERLTQFFLVRVSLPAESSYPDPTRFAELTGVNLEDLEGFAVGDQPAFASSTFEEDHDVEDQLPETVNEVAQSRRRRNHR